MKTNKWFKALPALVLAAGVAFSSCVKDGNDSKDTPAPEGYAYFSANVGTQTRTLTRADGYVGTDKGSAAENFVTKAYVLLFENKADDQALLVHRLEYDITNVNGSALQDFSGDIAATQPTTNKDVNVVTEARLVKNQAYKMVVVLNPTAEVTSGTVVNTTTLANFKASKAVTGASTFVGGASLNSFMMSNADDVVTITAADLYMTAALAEAAALADANARRVYVDRVVAKISVQQAGDGVTTGLIPNMDKHVTDGDYKSYDASTLSWYVNYVNPATFWMRKPTYAKGGSPTVENPTAREDYYAEDPNMDAANNASTTFITTSYATGFTTNLALNLPATANVAYTTENTLNEDQFTDIFKYGTQVVVQVKIVPNIQGVTLSANDSYYSFKGFVFTHAQALDWLFGSNPVVPSDVPGGSLTAWKAILTAAGFFPTNSATEPTGFSVATNGMTFHFEGWNVYSIPIKHFADVNDDEWGYYGVVRNNYYKVTITDISGPGSGSTDKYISAYITINPWLVRNQDEAL